MRTLFRATRFGRRRRHAISALLVALFISGCSLNPYSLRATPVALPGGAGGIGFDDMTYDPHQGKVIVPAGATGNLDLIDPDTLNVRPIAGFSAQTADPAGGHGDGTTSAIAAKGLLFALDRTSLRLNVVDPAAGAILKATSVLTTPDYVRYVPPTNELWVTEKGARQIEVFSLSDANVPIPTQTAVITFTSGPEALVIDPTRGRAYTNFAKKSTTIAIDLKTHETVGQWANGCTASRGLALDEARGLLFAACKEGKIAVLDANNDGRQLANISFGGGVDFIGYNPHLSHLYLPSGTSAILGIIGVTAVPDPTAPPTVTVQLSVTLNLLGTADTAINSRCMTVDDRDNAWVCDPNHGQIFRIKDTFPASGQ
jgi:hypothetical protein